MSKEIDVGLLRTLLRYEPETGKLFWLPRDASLFEPTAARTAEHLCRWWNARFANREAFTATCAVNGRQGKIFGQMFYAHRVAWALHTGAWPKDDIDHEDGDRFNNRIRNLRDATHRQNMQNKALYRSNSSGQHGVAFHKGKQRWAAYITVNGKRRQIGAFVDRADAIAARQAAERDAGVFHQNHGRAA